MKFLAKVQRRYDISAASGETKNQAAKMLFEQAQGFDWKSTYVMIEKLAKFFGEKEPDLGGTVRSLADDFGNLLIKDNNIFKFLKEYVDNDDPWANT